VTGHGKIPAEFADAACRCIRSAHELAIPCTLVTALQTRRPLSTLSGPRGANKRPFRSTVNRQPPPRSSTEAPASRSTATSRDLADAIEKHIGLRRRSHDESAKYSVRRFRLIDAEFRRLAARPQVESVGGGEPK
jgi:hypothetical protein